MTREEASKVIKDGLEDMSLDFADEEQYEALTMAIKALQEPTDRIEYGTDGNAYKLWISNGKEYEPSGDLISRQSVFEQIHCWIGSGEYRYTNATHYLTERVKHIPSVNPQEPKTGHWISRPHIYGVAFCSECGFELKINNTNYCPNCGAKMVEPQERSDKE